MIDIDKYFLLKRRLIEKTLEAVLPREGERPSAIHRAMRYSVTSGGKRLRPILCLAACEAVNGNVRNALYPAVAVEILHSYTLIHDDLPCMDNSNFRRGKPTVHKVFGEANAVLAGDALQALAFSVLAHARLRKGSGPLELVKELSGTAGSRGIVGGQVEDLAALDRGAGIKTIEWIHARKTALLFRAAVRLGAIAGEGSARQLAALSRYGFHLGMAFQIVDDILDDKQDKRARKPARFRGRLKPQNLSCIPVYGRTGAIKMAYWHILRACGALRFFPRKRVRPLFAIADMIARHLK